MRDIIKKILYYIYQYEHHIIITEAIELANIL